MGDIISLGILGLTLLMLFTGFLVGVIRGLRKSVHRIIWMAAILLICIIFVPMISNALFTAEFAFFNFTVNGTTVHSISDFIRLSALHSEDIGRLVESKPEVVDAVLKIASLLLNSILLIVMFWLLKILTLPFYAFFARNKKHKDKIKHKHTSKKGEIGLAVEVEEVKPPKRRLLGGLVGVGIAIIIIAATFSPFVGVGMMLVNVNNNVQVVDETTAQTVGILESAMGPEGAEIIDALENGIGTKVLTFSGIKYLSLGTFMSVTSANVDGYKFSLYNEINGLSSLAGRVMNYTNYDYEHITENEIDTMISDADAIANSLFDSGLVSIFGHYFIPYFLEDLSTNTTFAPTGNEVADVAIRAALGQLALLDVKEYQGDLVKLVDIAEILNDGNFLYPAISGQLKTTNDYFNVISEEMVNQVFAKILSFSTISTVLPTAIDAGLDVMAEELDIQITKYTGEFNDDARMEFAAVFGNMYGIVKSLNFPEGDEEMNPLDMITKDTFVQMGQLLDSIKNIRYITNTTYSNIMAKFENQLITEVNSGDVDKVVKDSVISIINSIFDITSFENAFTKIGEVYEIIKPMALELQDEEVTYAQISNYLDDMGRALDKLQESGLIGSIPTHISSLLQFVEDSSRESMLEAGFFESEIESIFNIIDDSQKSVVSYEAEFTALKGILDVMFATTYEDMSFVEMVINTNFLADLGKAIDEYNNKGHILTSENIIDIIEICEDVMLGSMPGEFGSLQGVIVQLIDNLGNINSWETELTHVKTIVNYFKPVMDSENVFKTLGEENYLTGLGATLDTIIETNSQLVNNAFVKEIMILGVDILSGFLPDIFSNSSTAKSDMINNIKAITNVSWENELGALEELITFDFSTLDYTNYNGFKELGAVLDRVTATSQIVDYNVVRDVVDGAIASSLVNIGDEDIIAFLNDGRTSLNNIRVTSWEQELDGIARLAAFDTNTIDLSTGAGLREFGILLDSIKGNVITNNTNITKLIARMVKSSSDDTSDEVVKVLLNAMYQTLQNQTVSNWTNEFNAINALLTFDRKNINNTTAEGLTTFGSLLDQVKYSTLLSPTNINKMLKEIFEDIVDANTNTTTNEHIVDIYEEWIAGISNLGNGGQNEYATEFACVEKLIGLTNNISLNNAATIGITFDEIRTSVLVGNSGRHALYMVVEDININNAISDMSQMKDMIKTNINTVLALVGETNPYTTIFTDLKTVADYINNVTSNDVDVNNYDYVGTGAMLDSFESMKTIGVSVTDLIAVEILTRINNGIDTVSNPELQTLQTYIDGTISTVKTGERSKSYTTIFTEINNIVNI